MEVEITMENYQIFISYRRDGGEALAGRIADRLGLLGYSVFYDVESMRSGTFNTQIYDAIEKCEDVILVLPPNGLDRCVNDDDWVRKEIVYSLNSKKNIIPVMMRGFDFPESLPEDISKIRFLEGVVASGDYFDAFVNRLVSLLKSKVGYKKVVDEIINLTKQYNWSYGVQTSDSGIVFINYAVEGQSNVDKVRLVVIVDVDDNITVVARNIIECSHCDKHKLYELLSKINKRSLYGIFELFDATDGTYIQERYCIHKAISNRAGVCLSMISELSHEVNRLYPEMVKVIKSLDF